MDLIKQFNEVMDYIDDNLQNDISYDRIAKLAGCSAYNFQRMFSYIADRTLSDYIRSRRMTMAALDILKSNERIIDISLKYGYESQDAFSRAFRNFHGVLPSVLKKENASLKSCPKLSFQITVKGAEEMRYQIEQWPAFKVAGFATKVQTDKAFEIVPKIWDKAWKDGTIQKLIEFFPDYRPAGVFGDSNWWTK